MTGDTTADEQSDIQKEKMRQREEQSESESWRWAQLPQIDQRRAGEPHSVVTHTSQIRDSALVVFLTDGPELPLTKVVVAHLSFLSSFR